MGCPEYVANVLSVAKIRLLAKNVLDNSSLLRDEKIIEISKTLKGSKFPFYIATPYLTSSFLVYTLIESKQDFTSPGYLGFINQQMSYARPQSSKKKKYISLKQLLALLPEKEPFQQLHPDFIIRVFQSLGILSMECHLIKRACKLDFKAKVVFAAFYSVAKKTKLEKITSEEQLQFLTRFKALAFVQDESPSLSLSNSQYQLPVDLRKDLMLLEKQFIWEEDLERKDRTYYLAMNSIRQMYLQAPYYEKIAAFAFPKSLYRRFRDARMNRIAKLERSIEYVYRASAGKVL